VPGELPVTQHPGEEGAQQPAVDVETDAGPGDARVRRGWAVQAGELERKDEGRFVDGDGGPTVQRPEAQVVVEQVSAGLRQAKIAVAGSQQLAEFLRRPGPAEQVVPALDESEADRGVPVQPRPVSLHVPALERDESPPEQIVERGGRGHQPPGGETLGGQGFPELVFYQLLVDHRQSQVGGADGERRHRQTPPDGAPAVQEGEHGQPGQEWQGVERVDHEDGVPLDPMIGERPEKLGPVAGETIQQRVGEQSPEGEAGPLPPRDGRVAPVDPVDQPAEQGREQHNKEDRVGGGTVEHEVLDRRQDEARDAVEVRDGAGHRAPEQRFVAGLTAEQHLAHPGAERDLGQRIHTSRLPGCGPIPAG